jgi:RNA polymerase sigma-70 factor (ECF subfamily)
MDPHTRTLVIRAQEHDSDAVAELFRRHRDRLYYAVRKYLGPTYRRTVADTEDVVHGAILSALRRIQDFDYRGEGSFLAWLLRSADFEVRTLLRKSARQKLRQGNLPDSEGTPSDEPVADLTSPSEAAARREEEERVRACLESLPVREHDIILLRRYLALDMGTICAEMDLPSPGAGRALLSRAQARLAGLLSRTDGP